jgi:tetratricopeptide (TPR) repeat protein
MESCQENFGSVLKDCSKALELNQKSSKAYYRSATALLALDRPDEAIDCCDRCLSFDQDNAPIRQIRERANKVKTEKERREKERQERIRVEQEVKMKLNKAFGVCIARFSAHIFIS